MRASRTPLALVVLLTLVGAAFAFASARDDAARARRVARGEYLTTIAACNDCHTPGFLFGAPDYERKLSGSELGWRGPWGVSFPRNLTPDPETGIGRWSEQDIVNAIRTGTRPDGSVLLPPMPWPNYAALSDEDAFAIAAYLKSLRPVTHRVPKQVPPGVAWTGPVMDFPAPPAWDAPRPSAESQLHAPTK